MVQRVGGFRRKTRYKLKKSYRSKGKVSISKYFQSFNIGDDVVFTPEPSIHEGMPLPRYTGKVGKIEGRQGECYKVAMMDGSKKKVFIVHPIHLTRRA